jgi:hypothetical protein
MATSSSSSTTTTPGATLTSFFSAPPININYTIHAKLTRDNFLVWQTQLLPFLIGHDLLGYVDGSQQPHFPSIFSRNRGWDSILCTRSYILVMDQLLLSTLSKLMIRFENYIFFSINLMGLLL